MKPVIYAMALLGAAMITTTAAFAQAVIDVANPQSGNGYEVSDGVITIASSGEYTLQGSTTSNRVVIAQDVTATITLNNVSITSDIASPFALDFAGCNVTLRIVGNNTLTSTVPDTEGEDRFCAAVQVEGSASLTIEDGGSPISSSPTPGSLTATSSAGAAGIGSGCIEHADGTSTAIAPGAINIKSGSVTAIGGNEATGIGGGAKGVGGTISITGGSVTATGGNMERGHRLWHGRGER